VANDGAEAIEMAKSAQFKLVILDLMMPKVDSFSVARLGVAASPSTTAIHFFGRQSALWRFSTFTCRLSVARRSVDSNTTEAYTQATSTEAILLPMSNSNVPSTAMQTNRNGNISNQTNG
jgi:DNA-binding NarL/FixJ family response regulator